MRSCCCFDKCAGRKTLLRKLARILSSSGEEVSANAGTGPNSQSARFYVVVRHIVIEISHYIL